MAGKQDDPLERIGKLIDDRISAAFNDRDRRAAEEKDPWARLEGMIDRAVSRHFEAFGQGLEEGKAGEEELKLKVKDGGRKDDEGGDFLTNLLGGAKG